MIERLAALAAVDQVWLQFYDTHEGEWPFSENVLIFGEAALSEVAAHAAAIEPTEVQELSLDWTPSRDPALHDRRHVNLWWD